MNFSISSTIMAVLVSNLFIFLLFLIFRKRTLLFRLGFPFLIGFIILIFIRMLFPIELLPISHNVYMPKPLAMIVGETCRVRFFDDTISWWNILEIVWVCGILYTLIKYIKRNYLFQRYVKEHAAILPENSMQVRIFSQIKNASSQKRIQKIQLYSLPFIKGPLIYGFRKPCILIPDTLELSEVEWKYVLVHEINHYIHKDLYTKLFLHIICIIYWWNPLCVFLKKDTDTILEMRIDQALTSTPAQKREYLSCLLKTASYQVSDPLPTPDFSINFCNSVLMQRFEVITKNTRTQNSNLFKFFFLISAVFLFFSSYFIIFEDNYFPPDQFTDDMIIPTKDNCFVIECQNGGYDFYLYGEYIETLPDKKYCISDITTYKNIEEARKHEKIILEK